MLIDIKGIQLNHAERDGSPAKNSVGREVTAHYVITSGQPARFPLETTCPLATLPPEETSRDHNELINKL